MFYDRSFSINFLSYIQNWFFGKHWPLTNNQKLFLNKHFVIMIIICMRVFLKQITPFSLYTMSDQHLFQPKFFAILMWSTKTWAYFKSYIEGINILVTVWFYLMMFRLNQRWSTLTYYSVLRGKMTSSKNNWIGQHQQQQYQTICLRFINNMTWQNWHSTRLHWYAGWCNY